MREGVAREGVAREGMARVGAGNPPVEILVGGDSEGGPVMVGAQQQVALSSVFLQNVLRLGARHALETPGMGRHGQMAELDFPGAPDPQQHRTQTP